METANGWTQARGRRTPSLPGAQSCTAVDLHGDAAVAVRARRGGRGVHCTRVELAAGPGGGPGAAADNTVACLNTDECLVRWLEAPFASPGKAARVWPTLLDVELPFPVEECTYAFLDVHKTRAGRTRALAVAARNVQLEAKLSRLRGKGVDPVVLDCEGLALHTQNLFEAPLCTEDRQAPRVLVSLAAGTATVVLSAAGAFTGAIAAGRADSAAIARILRTQLRPKPASVRWYWTGDGASDAAALSALQEPLRTEWPGPSVTHADPASFLARALARRALRREPLSCNLRAGRWIHPAAAARARRREGVGTALIAVAGLALAAGSAFALLTMARSEERCEAEFTRLRDLLVGYRLPVRGDKAVEAARSETVKRVAALAPFVRAMDPAVGRRLGAVAQTARDTGLTIESLSLDDATLTLAGTAERWNGWVELVRVIEQAGYRVTVQPGQIMVANRLPFRIATVDHE